MQNSTENLQQIIKKIELCKEELKEEYNIISMGIFGSYARSEQKTGSDIDIVIDFSKPPGLKMVDLKDYLDQKLGLYVDIVTKNAIQRKPMLWDSISRELINV